MLSSLIKPNPNSRKSPLEVSKKTEKKITEKTEL